MFSRLAWLPVIVSAIVGSPFVFSGDAPDSTAVVDDAAVSVDLPREPVYQSRLDGEMVVTGAHVVVEVEDVDVRGPLTGDDCMRITIPQNATLQSVAWNVSWSAVLPLSESLRVLLWEPATATILSDQTGGSALEGALDSHATALWLAVRLPVDAAAVEQGVLASVDVVWTGSEPPSFEVAACDVP